MPVSEKQTLFSLLKSSTDNERKNEVPLSAYIKMGLFLSHVPRFGSSRGRHAIIPTSRWSPTAEIKYFCWSPWAVLTVIVGIMGTRWYNHPLLIRLRSTQSWSSTVSESFFSWAKRVLKQVWGGLWGIRVVLETWLFLQQSTHSSHYWLEIVKGKINLFLPLKPSCLSLSFRLDERRKRQPDPSAAGLGRFLAFFGTRLKPEKIEPALPVWGNNRSLTGGTAGSALALFLPAVIWRCLLTTHDAANEHCFLCLRVSQPSICQAKKKYVFSQQKPIFIHPEGSVKKVSLLIAPTYEGHWWFCKTSSMRPDDFVSFSEKPAVTWLAILFTKHHCYCWFGCAVALKCLPAAEGEEGEPLCLIDSG